MEGYLEYSIDGVTYEYTLQAQTNKIGRASDCDLQLLHDSEISRHHCTINFGAKKRFLIVDEKSHNGTFVNDENISTEPKFLSPGDVITVGKTEFTYNERQIGSRTICIIEDVASNMEKGKGYNTIMNEIIGKKKE